MKCSYCKKQARFCENKEIYGRNYGKSYMCYYCQDCDARVGVHNNRADKPLGTMANKELRHLRVKVHSIIDPLWKSGKMKRKQVYKLLEDTFGRKIHIGESDEKTCLEIIKIYGKTNKNFRKQTKKNQF